MTYRGIVRGRTTIELAEEPPLPEGTDVEVSLSLPAPAKAEAIARPCAGMLKDLSPKRLEVFEEALAGRSGTARGLRGGDGR